jgi:ribosomal protein L36
MRPVAAANLAGLVTATLMGVSEPVAAAIRCVGDYQIVRGQQIATPYCQDNHLAQVARQYGMRVSGDAIRNSPSVKAQACRLVGRDNRVQVACAPYDSFRRRPF